MDYFFKIILEIVVIVIIFVSIKMTLKWLKTGKVRLEGPGARVVVYDRRIRPYQFWFTFIFCILLTVLLLVALVLDLSLWF